MPSYMKIKKSDFDTFLINKGEPMLYNSRFKIITVNPFKKTITYRTKIQKTIKIKYVFYLKENTYKVIN